MDRQKSKYKEVYQYLYNDINNGTYQPGQMIPTEKELMEQFNVSRVTTNRALQLLVNEGIIERKAGIGSFVSNNLDETKIPAIPTAPSTIESNTTKQIRKIGLVVPYISSIYGNRILSELEGLCTKQNIVLSVACSYAEQEQEKEAINRLVASGVEGLVVFPVNGDYYNEALLKLNVEKFPLVLIDKNLQGVPFSCVSTNNEKAAYDLTSHLIKLNHQHIGFIMPLANSTSTLIERLDGYRSALTDANLPVREEFILSGVDTVNINNNEVDGRYLETLKLFFYQHPEITAVVATDDAIAQNVLEIAISIGKKVPEDLSIACFDGPRPRLHSWNFTHMEQDEVGMARKTFEILIRLMNDTTRQQAYKPVHIELTASFQMGESTAKRP
ncbi:GntR family transcriptional regulator [Alicyclobacillus fodiniaquatilis]|uniref:GntR family transcriptional regulator n=1 Tax=Alicyclobacillus fodiniaquatilis TaxID=1661150 RepID=A0ABW4JHL6_9BACL